MSDLVKVWDGGDVDEIDDGKVLDLFRDRVEGLVHGHALGVPVVAEADDDDAVLFGLDGLVDVPARGQMGEKVRHGAASCGAGTARVHVSESSSAENFCPLINKRVDRV